MFYTDKKGREYYRHDNFRDYNLSPLRDLAYNQAARADGYADSAANARVDGSAGHAVQPGQNVGMGMGHDRGRMAAQESGNTMQQAMRAMEGALDQEAATVQDRQMDLAENSLATSNQTQRHAASMQNDAAKYAADAARIPAYGQGAGNVGNPLEGLYANAPNINLYSSDGQRIGGSYYNR